MDGLDGCHSAPGGVVFVLPIPTNGVVQDGQQEPYQTHARLYHAVYRIALLNACAPSAGDPSSATQQRSASVGEYPRSAAGEGESAPGDTASPPHPTRHRTTASHPNGYGTQIVRQAEGGDSGEARREKPHGLYVDHHGAWRRERTTGRWELRGQHKKDCLQPLAERAVKPLAPLSPPVLVAAHKAKRVDPQTAPISARILC